MSPADGDGARRDWQLGPEELKQLAAEMARMFPTEPLTLDFLLRVMRLSRGAISGFDFVHGPDPAHYETSDAYWRRIIPELDREGHTGLLVRTVHEHKRVTPGFEMMFPHSQAPSEAGQAAVPRVNGCHAILLTTDEQIRAAVRDWLEEAELAPLQVWTNHDMTSFEVVSSDAAEVARLISSRYPLLLVKVIPPGQLDTRIDWVEVSDVDGLELHVPNVPSQLTIGQFGESSTRFHPARASAPVQASGRRRVERVHHTGLAVDRWPRADHTLLEAGVDIGHRLEIKSVKYQPIRVVFVAASPLWNGQGHLSEVQANVELNAISQQADRGHIDLVGEFLAAKRSDLVKILAKKPDILHLACHGLGGQLLWEDRGRAADALQAEWLAKQIRERARHRLSGILLSACEGESTGPAFTTAALTVITHSGPLPGNLAEAFATNFYEELFAMPVLRTAAERAAESIGRKVLIFSPDMQGGS